MKKTLFILSITALLFSCKKETKTAAFTPTDNTGTARIKGNTSKNVITPSGVGTWINTSRVPAAGVNVSVRILKSALYPGSNAQGADVYTGTTDANGNFDIAVKANGNGVAANIVIDGFSSTLDTIVNGVKKTGLPCLYLGTSLNPNAFSGQTTFANHNFVASNVGSNPNNITLGSAIVTGTIGMNFVRQYVAVVSGTPQAPVYSTTNVIVPAGTKVYLDLTIDPSTLAPKQYMATTDATGGYTFNLSTVAAGTAGFNQNSVISMPDYARSRDTVKVTAMYTGTVLTSTSSSITPGLQGVYQSTQVNQNGLFNGEIRNAVNLNYGTFTPN
jgi:hypothetical protein